jgi:hypothetical protein
MAGKTNIRNTVPKIARAAMASGRLGGEKKNARYGFQRAGGVEWTKVGLLPIAGPMRRRSAVTFRERNVQAGHKQVWGNRQRDRSSAWVRRCIRQEVDVVAAFSGGFRIVTETRPSAWCGGAPAPISRHITLLSRARTV